MTELEMVGRHLEAEAPEIGEQAARDIYGELPGYAVVPREDLLASVRVNVLRGVCSILANALPTENDEAEPRRTTRHRLTQGMAIEDIIRAYRISLNAIHRRFIELSEEMGLDSAATLRGSTLLWEVGDWFVSLAVREYRTRAVNDEVRRRVEKSDVIRLLVGPDPLSPGIRRRAEDLGMNLNIPLQVVLGHRQRGSQSAWVRGLERAGSLPAAAAVATESDGATLAIVARSPTGMGVHGVLAGGTWADAADLGSSRNVAEQVMSVIGMQSGDWHDFSTVTWRLAVPSHPLVNRLLEARYVEPLRADPRGEQLLATLWSYLDNDRNVKRTADALVIHENTLRYRLSRLEDLIGGKLDETNRLVELMWVRQALEVDNQPITRP